MAQNVRRDVDTPGAQVWDRLSDESDRAWAAFKKYRDMGLHRSQWKVAEELDYGYSLVAKYSRKFSWVLRAAAWDDEQDRQDRAWLADERKKALARHVRQAQALTSKWVQALQSLDPARMTPSEVIRWAEVATKLEREALQMDPTLNVHLSGSVDMISTMSAEDTMIRLRALQQEMDLRLEVIEEGVPDQTLPVRPDPDHDHDRDQLAGSNDVEVVDAELVEGTELP